MFAESPVMRAEEVPTADEVDLVSQQVSVPFPDDYREFLLRYGGATVGAYPVFGLRVSDVMDHDRWALIDVTNEVRQSGVDGVSDWVIFSEDHSGNPIGMDADGKVWIFDHDFGGVTELASGFENYIRTQCLRI
jgi:hypothetical protein